MIDQRFAQDFVTKIYRQLHVNVNVMNEKAVIIASAMPERIGDFHICAYQIIQQRLPILKTEEITKDLIGVNVPGVNMLLLEGQEPIGVVGVSGKPEEVLQIAKTIKFALESLLTASYRSAQTYLGQQDEQQFSYSLLQEKPQNSTRILKLASRLGYQQDTTRVPLLITLSSERPFQVCCSLKEIYAGLTTSNRQDMVLGIDNQRMMLFFAPDTPVKTDYRAATEDLCAEIQASLYTVFSREGLSLRFYCGLPQTHLLEYWKSYEVLKWLKNNSVQSKRNIEYISDYALEYMVDSGLSGQCNLLLESFNSYTDLLLANVDKEVFLQTVGALLKESMSISEAAKEVYVHKNTLSRRIKLIKDCMGIKPFNNVRDAIFLAALYAFIVRRVEDVNA